MTWPLACDDVNTSRTQNTRTSHTEVCEYYNLSTSYMHKINLRHTTDCLSTNHGLITSHEVDRNHTMK